jgi:CP family cyanate transporter-like MFS transporter
MEREATSTTAGHALLLAAVALAGLNLRPFITGVGPLATNIGAQTGLDPQGIALLTLVPMFLMGVLAFAGPSLQARVGARRSIVAALVVLGLGSLLRLFVSTGWEMVGTAALLGFGAATVQAVFPGVIKERYPRHVGIVMGLYSAMLMGGGALGAQAAPLIAATAGGWRAGLAWMALPAVLAVGLVVRSLPKDTSRRKSGSLLAIMAVCQAVAALLLPVLAGRKEDRRPWLWLTLVMQAVGFVALALKPEAAPLLWMVLLGAGLGGCFSLSMIVALEHLRDPAQAGALSALMQGGGFLIAAMPPWIVAVLHDLTGSYRAGWGLHLFCVAVVTVLYWRVSPGSYAVAMNLATLAPRARAASH